MLQFKQQMRVMEADTIQKNEASPKSLMSRGNFMQKFILTLIGIMFVSVVFAQSESTLTGDPRAGEQVIGTVTETAVRSRDDVRNHQAWVRYSPHIWTNEANRILLEKARRKFPNRVIELRNVKVSIDNSTHTPAVFTGTGRQRRMVSSGFTTANFTMTARVVDLTPPPPPPSPAEQMNETLVRAIDRALLSVPPRARLAIDQMNVTGSLSRETVNDQLVDILLDRNYRVVAREFLERLREEQEEQQQGGFSERTIVATDNFTAVGFFVNVRVTDESIRIQVINVSTGEFAGTATVNF